MNKREHEYLLNSTINIFRDFQISRIKSFSTAFAEIKQKKIAERKFGSCFEGW